MAEDGTESAKRLVEKQGVRRNPMIFHMKIILKRILSAHRFEAMVGTRIERQALMKKPACQNPRPWPPCLVPAAGEIGVRRNNTVHRTKISKVKQLGNSADKSGDSARDATFFWLRQPH